mgnify:CR=1 FL=1
MVLALNTVRRTGNTIAVSIQEEATQARAEAKAANIKNNDLKRSLDEITLQLHRRVGNVYK